MRHSKQTAVPHGTWLYAVSSTNAPIDLRYELSNSIWHGTAFNGGAHFKVPKVKPLMDLPDAPAGFLG
jgi:hypothetical protein